jgi:hypothetical protein
MKYVCANCGTTMTAADVVRAGNMQHPESRAICRDCTYNPAPERRRPAAEAAVH